MLREAVLVLVIYVGAEAQEVTFPRVKPSKYAKPTNAYYNPPFYPGLNMKPGASYKAIPPYYNPWDVCFNPNYYGFLRTGGLSQVCPMPQPNIYYNLPTAPSASPYPNPQCQPPLAQPGYVPWTWNTYPYIGQPLSPSSPTEPKPMPTHDVNLNTLHKPIGTSRTLPQNQSIPETTTKPPIKITKPTITVKITPPVYNENDTAVTDAFDKPNPHTVQEPVHKKLDQTTRSMIKHLLELGSKRNRSSDESKNAGRGDMSADCDEDMVIRSAREQPSNVYPLPKTVYGDTNEPSSVYDKWKIFTEFTQI